MKRLLYVLLLLACFVLLTGGTSKILSNTWWSYHLDPPRYWNTQIMFNQAKTTAAADPDFIAFKGGTYLYAFDAAADEELYFNLQLANSYMDQEDIYVRIRWAGSSAGAGNVRWCVEYTIQEEAVLFPVTATLCDKQANPGDEVFDSLALGTISAVGLDDTAIQIVGRVYRDADHVGDDTYADDAYGLSLTFSYPMDFIGTHTPTTKF